MMEHELKSNEFTTHHSTNSQHSTDPENSPYISVFLRLGFQEEAEAAAKAIAEEREKPGTLDSAQRLLRAEKNPLEAVESVALAHKPWALNMNELEAASFALAHSDSTPYANDVERDDGANSEYYSALSVACGTETTGLQSQIGATWPYAITCTANTGFSFGIPRSEKWKGVREGREEELGLGIMKGVGRTGKRTQMVPDAMIRAVMEESNAERIWPQWVVDEGKERFVAHILSGVGLGAYQMQGEPELQLGDLEILEGAHTF